jgi:hypothetical protein
MPDETCLTGLEPERMRGLQDQRAAEEKEDA